MEIFDVESGEPSADARTSKACCWQWGRNYSSRQVASHPEEKLSEHMNDDHIKYFYHFELIHLHIRVTNR
jgi:hypothetical protein